MGYTRLIFAAGVALAIAAVVSAKKKNPDEITQTLEMPKDPPMVAVGETSRLVFHVSPLTGRGLLSQQTREALKSVLKQNGGAQIVHIRAFVAGSGDARRVPQIVSEVFTEKKLALPSVSVVQAGGLPVENAQVVLEVISNGKHDVNPDGLVFVPGQTLTAPGGASPVKPLLEKSLDALETKLGGASPLEATCFVSGISDASALLSLVSSRLPGAAIDVVQSQRAPWQAMASCEGIGKGGQVKSGRLAFSGTQIAFGSEEKDAARAFERLHRDLEETAGGAPAIIATNVYSLSPAAADLARKLWTAGGALTVVPIDGVAAMDAGFAVDAVAAIAK